MHFLFSPNLQKFKTFDIFIDIEEMRVKIGSFRKGGEKVYFYFLPSFPPQKIYFVAKECYIIGRNTMKRKIIMFFIAVLIAWQADALSAPTVLHFNGRIDDIDPSSIPWYSVAQGWNEAAKEGDYILASGQVVSWGNLALFLIPSPQEPTAAVWTKPDKPITLTNERPTLGVQFRNSDFNDELAEIYLIGGPGGLFSDWTFIGSVNTNYVLYTPDGQDNYALILGLPAGDYGAKVVANYWGDVHLEAFCATSIIPAPGALVLGGIGIGLVGWLRRRRTL
jgi:hypothetical protein